MSDPNRKTLIMRSPDRVTKITPRTEQPTLGDTAQSDMIPALSVGMVISGYKIIDVIAENTGEATLLLAAKDSEKYVMKFFHKGIVPDPAIFSKLGTIPKEFLVHPLVRANLGDRAVYIYRYFKNGDLSKSMPLSEQVVTNTVVPSVCAALERIHGAGLIHRDIKPENLMWNDEKNGVLLSDFGISSLLEKGASIRRTKGSGTAGYTAPETLNGYVSAKSDYYSFGVTLLCLLMGMDPFAGMTDAQIIFNVINKQLEIPSFISDRMRRLIKGLTIKDRGLRWGADEVKQWLSGSSQGTAPAGIG